MLPSSSSYHLNITTSHAGPYTDLQKSLAQIFLIYTLSEGAYPPVPRFLCWCNMSDTILLSCRCTAMKHLKVTHLTVLALTVLALMVLPQLIKISCIIMVESYHFLSAPAVLTLKKPFILLTKLTPFMSQDSASTARRMFL